MISIVSKDAFPEAFTLTQFSDKTMFKVFHQLIILHKKKKKNTPSVSLIHFSWAISAHSLASFIVILFKNTYLHNSSGTPSLKLNF